MIAWPPSAVATDSAQATASPPAARDLLDHRLRDAGVEILAR